MDSFAPGRPLATADIFFILPSLCPWVINLQMISLSRVFNSCLSGNSIHLLRVIELLREISGHDPRIEIDEAFVRKGEIKDLCGSPRRLFEAVGEIHTNSHREILQHIYQSLNHIGAPGSTTGT